MFQSIWCVLLNSFRIFLCNQIACVDCNSTSHSIQNDSGSNIDIISSQVKLCKHTDYHVPLSKEFAGH